jgi:seryl-tRNA synthetase
MPKKLNLKHQIEDPRNVDTIERIITAIELQEALQRLLQKARAKHEELEKETVKLKRRNDELKELIKQHHSYIKSFPKGDNHA